MWGLALIILNAVTAYETVYGTSFYAFYVGTIYPDILRMEGDNQGAYREPDAVEEEIFREERVSTYLRIF